MEARPEKNCSEYTTTGTVAKHCGVSKVTVLRWIQKGILAAFKLPGGQNRIYIDDFYLFVTAHGIPIKKYMPINRWTQIGKQINNTR